LIAALFIIAKLWNQPGGAHTMWYICPIEYYSPIKKNEIRSFIGKCMELEVMMLSEIIQTEKDKYHMFSFICGT
jgi:ferredoxin-like protein FixX